MQLSAFSRTFVLKKSSNMKFLQTKHIFYIGCLLAVIPLAVAEAISVKKAKNEYHEPRLVEAKYPTTRIEVPKVEFPPFVSSGKLDTIDSPRKPITTKFTDREINHVGVQDPLRFKNSSTEIIDLSLIQEDDYAFPLPNGHVISPYGGKRKHHSGYDIKTRPNDTIVSAFDGVVRLAKPYAAYGNVIVVRHYNGLETVYSHNSKNLVKPGDVVKAGTPIALTGRTGRATTAHLHFEVRIDGVHFNPNYVFNFSRRTLKRECLICKKVNGQITVKPTRALPNYLLKKD